MRPKLYDLENELSPPVRSVLLAAKAIGLEFEIKVLNFEKKEHLTEEFRRINPQHTVPTLEEEDGFVLCDSHAILPYIIEKYAKNDEYYPKDLRIRSTIQHRLHFDTMSSISRGDAIKPLFYEGATSIPEKLVKTIKEHYNILEAFLEKTKWMAADSVTIADFSLIPSVTTLNIVVPLKEDETPKLVKWMKNAEEWAYYDENRRGHVRLEAMIREILEGK